MNDTSLKDEEKQIRIDDLQFSLDNIPDDSQTMPDSESYSTSSESSSSSLSDSSDNEIEISSISKSKLNKNELEDPLNFDISDDEATIRDVPLKKKDDSKEEDKLIQKIDNLVDTHSNQYFSELCDNEINQFIKVKQSRA